MVNYYYYYLLPNLFVQMAKHVGLIPSLDGGLYQVNEDKVEVTLIYALFLILFIV